MCASRNEEIYDIVRQILQISREGTNIVNPNRWYDLFDNYSHESLQIVYNEYIT